MRHLIPFLVAAASIMITAPAYADLGDELFKLLADDGADSDFFGVSTAISGATAIIGAYGNDDNGDQSGSAYLFDATTGNQIAKLLPSDGTANDRFGSAVAIDGATALVGARLDDDNGDGSGYLFDTTTGQQIAKLLAEDGETVDYFGWSVAIDGIFAVVGCLGDDDNGQNSGSAYVFDANTGQQLTKLLPNDGAAGDDFGSSVAINGNIVVVGAWKDDDNDEFSGSAYLFDISIFDQPLQLAKLVPSDNAANDWFGYSVAIGDANAIVAAVNDNDNGSSSGSAYLFSIVIDTDGDGLLDSWENNGIPVEGSNMPFILEGADPMRKDIYVEVDAMVGLGPDASVPQMIVDAFANAPVPNPDGSTGITFHFVLDETDLPPEPWTLDSDTDNDGFLDWVSGFDAAMNDHFGTSAEQGNAALLEAKGKAYRYCIFGHSYDVDGSSGIANGLPGHLFMVTLGQWATYGGTTEEQAGTFMHELGHCLGLGHGGNKNDHIHFKPNYYSVMNYSWQTPKSNYPGWRLDYSHAALPTLDELALNEAAGLGAAPGEFSGVFVPFNGPNGQIWLADMEGGLPIDWNVNGSIDQSAVQQNLNYLYAWQESPPDQPLPGHDDWSNLIYDFRGTAGYANGDYGGSTADSSFTYDMHVFLESIPAPGTGVVLETIAVDNGTHLDGDIPDITKPDDAFEHHVRSGFGPNIVNLRYTEVSILGTAVNLSPTSIDLMVRSNVTLAGVTTQLRLRNWNTGSFDLAQSYAADTTPTTYTISDIDASQYVDKNGEVELSIKQIVNGPFAGHLAFTFDSFIDWVQIAVK